MTPENRFLFETFARSSETVIICRSGETGDFEAWRDWVPEGVRVVESKESVAGNPVHCPALRRLVEDEG
jgi:ABC-type sulfate transport system substrate-binding protein